MEVQLIKHTEDSFGKATETEVTIEKDTKEELFKSFYGMNNALRYCNGWYYKFKNPKDESEYNKWYNNLSRATRFDMYYGNGTVD